MSFPSNPTDQQEYVAGTKTFRYNATTGRWRVFKAQSTGSAAITQADLDTAVANVDVTSQVNAIVNAAPEALDTLDELAAALNDDANFATTVTNSLATKANSADVYTQAEVDSAIAAIPSFDGDLASDDELRFGPELYVAPTYQRGAPLNTYLYYDGSSNGWVNIPSSNHTLQVGDIIVEDDAVYIGSRERFHPVLLIEATRFKIGPDIEFGGYPYNGNIRAFYYSTVGGGTEIPLSISHNSTTDTVRFVSGRTIEITSDVDLGTNNITAANLVTQADIDSAVTAKANTADLATVATSGSYNDLTNLPDLSNSGGVTATTLTKTFAENEEHAVTLAEPIDISPVVSGTKEVAPSDVITKSQWDVNATGSNYDLHDTAYDTTLAKGTSNIPVPFQISSAIEVASDGVLLNPYGVAYSYDGTKLYVMDTNTSAVIRQYTLPTAFDLSTRPGASVGAGSVSSETSAPRGFCFSDNGLHLYVTDASNDRVYQYSLSTAWDISTISYTGNSVTAQNGASCCVIHPDGTTLWAGFYGYPNVRVYTMTTPYDLSTATEGTVSPNLATSPQSIGFNSDGTKFFSATDTIYEYSLTTPYDLSTLSYGGINSGDLGTPKTAGDFSSNGLYFIAGGTSDDLVKQFSISSTAVNDTLNLGTGSFSSADVGKRVIAGGGEAVITSADGEYIESSSIPDVTYLSGQWEMYGLDVNSTNGIESSVGYTTINGYDISTASYDSKSLSFGVTANTPYGMFFKPDGTKLYIANNGNDNIVEYTLSTAWDVSTGIYVQDFSVNAQETILTDVFFKSDGLTMFIIGVNGDDINEYSLSTAWDISTASYVQTSGNVGDTAPQGLWFKPDGTKLYVIGNTNSRVREFSLSTAWDISTMTFVQNFSITADLYGIQFNTDGTKFFVVDQDANLVREFSVATPWDISTASENQTFNVGSVISLPVNVFFKPDGSKMYLVNISDDKIVQYSLGSTTTYAFSEYSSAITNASGQISTGAWADINSMTPDENVSGTSEVYYAVSADNKQTFKIVNGTLGERTIVRYNVDTWEYNSDATYSLESWTAASSNDSFTALNEAIKNNSTNRMDSTQLSAVGDDYQYTLGDTLDLAIVMKSDGTNIPSSDGVSINYTGQLYNAGAILGTDYTYIHNDNTTVTITALNAGNYKFRIL